MGMRKNGLYLRLSLTNLWKNRQTYFPFLLSGVFSTFVFYTFLMIGSNPGIANLERGSGTLQVFMNLGSIIVAVFTLIFLFYANSFLIKRRKKELGLYAILGLEKRHVARTLAYESLFSYVITMVFGLGLGMLLGKLFFLIIGAIMQVPTVLHFSLHSFPIYFTLLLFAGVFFVLYLHNAFQVRLQNPIRLLRGENRGEKEPKTHWFFGFIGLVAMVAGYVIALSVKNPTEAALLFFLAVLLVIIGTYALFTSISIGVLKMLKRNKRYYYKANHFISVSGMLYRMKQNAAGLASICILSTMVMVTVGTTTALYIGQERLLKVDNPTEFTYRDYMYDDEHVSRATFMKVAEAAGEKHGQEITDLFVYKSLSTGALREDRGFASDREYSYKDRTIENNNRFQSLTFLTLEEYEKLTGMKETLEPKEILYFQSTDYPTEGGILYFGDTPLTVKQELASLPIANKGMTNPESYVIVRDEETILALYNGIYPSTENIYPSTSYAWNTEGDAASKLAYGEEMSPHLSSSVLGYYFQREQSLSVTGSFLFLGVFLGALFLMATVLIIYFKQVSEGYQDRDRYIIMQKVGLSKKEVRQNVRKQILTIFLLPLAVATIHTTGALLMVKRILFLFGITDERLVALCVYLTVVLFGVIYTLVYMATAKVYNKMVEMK